MVGVGSAGFSGDNGPAASAQLSNPDGIAIDNAGALYIADFYNNRIRKVSNGVITTAALLGGPIPSGGAGPVGIAVDSAGNVYIADGIIRKVSNGVITTVAQEANGGFSGPLLSVAVDFAGNLYIPDPSGGRVRKVSGGAIVTVAGNGTQSFSGDNGLAIYAQLSGGAGVAVDAAGNLYIADSENNRIRKVSSGVIATVAGNGTAGFSGDNGPAAFAELSRPEGVAVDTAGNLYIADSSNSRIRKVSNEVISTVAGGGAQISDNAAATSAHLFDPECVAVDSAGNFYITDQGSQIVRKVSNGVIVTVAGNGNPAFGGPATSAGLSNPKGIAVDSAGNLYIADSANNRIRKISSGVIATIAGNGTAGFSGDGGAATSAALAQPSGVVVDSIGNVYITDSANNRIRKVSDGVIATVAGGGASFGDNGGGDNGAANGAQLSLPYGIAMDSGGNLFVADTGNDRIRVLKPAACIYSASPNSFQTLGSSSSLIVTIETTASCYWIVSALPPWISVSGPSFGAGSATVVLSVAPNPAGARTATISVAGIAVQVTQPSSPPVPSINTGGIVNAASSAAGSPVAPGSIATVYGSFLIDSLFTASSSPLPLSLGGLSIQFGGGFSAPLFADSGGQVNFQVPWELAGQSQTTISATVNDLAGGTQSMTLAPFAPGIFSMNGQGTGQGAILDTSYRLVDSSNPAIAGSTVLQIYCTGLGAVTSQPPSGWAPLDDQLSLTKTIPTVMIGGVQARVLFSGLAPGSVGEYQVDAIIPAGSPVGAAVPVVIAIGGAISNTVTIAVQ